MTKGVFSMDAFPESLKFLTSVESLDNIDRILLCFPQSGGLLASLNSLDALDHRLF